jgi:hypothetical protein
VLDLAEDTYRLVWRSSEDAEVRVMAQDALAYCAALRGDAIEYERRRRAVRVSARRASPYLRVQIGYFRGEALRALGNARAVRVLRAAERFARAHGLAEWVVRAGALAGQAVTAPVPTKVTVRAPEEVRVGIEKMLAARPGAVPADA